MEELKEKIKFYTSEVKNLKAKKHRTRYDNFILNYNKEVLKRLKAQQKD